MIDVVRFRPVLAFFNSSASDYLISDGASASYSGLIRIDLSRGLVKKVG